MDSYCDSDENQPIALRETDLIDILQTDEETVLQAAILEQSNEGKFQSEIDQALALSLLDSENNPFGSLIFTSEHSPKSSHNSQTVSVSTDRHLSQILQTESIVARGPCFHGYQDIPESNFFPDSGPQSLETEEYTSPRNNNMSSVNLVRRKSLDILPDLDDHESTQENETVDRTEQDEEMAREVAELIKRGIIKRESIVPRIHRKVESFDTPDSSKSDQACAISRTRRPSLERIHTPNSNFHESREQTVKKNGERGIKFLMPVPFSSDNLPENWMRNDIGEHGSVHMYKLVPMETDCAHYDAILDDFEDSGLTVLEINRLQNVYLLEKFKSEQDQILNSRLPGFKLNCRYLYHGTPADKGRICEEGLDARLSRMGCFGKGIYFSDNPKKCLQYTGIDKNIENILMCRVILGDSKEYPPGVTDSNLRREPEKEEITHGWRYYDSVSGRPIDFNEYVVYENRRAMIEYIITYKTTPKSTGTTSINSVGPQRTATQLLNPSNSKMTDEEHMEIVETVRDSIRKQRCAESGTIWQEPSKEERDNEREKWKSIKTSSCTREAVKQGKSVRDEEEDDAIKEVMRTLITDFVQVTNVDDVDQARNLLENANMDLNTAIEMYYSSL